MAAHTWGERTSYDGNAVNWALRYIFIAAVKMLATPHFGGERSGITVHQGSWSGGPQSAGTHTKRSVADTSWFNWRNRVLVFRLLGCAAWYRPRSSRWIPHIHLVVAGDEGVHWLAAQQVVDYWRNPPGSGLGSVGSQRDNGPKMYGARPLFVFPEKAVGKPGKMRCKVACHSYTRQTTAAPQYGAQVAVGEEHTAVAFTRDARTGKLWFVTATGRCFYADNFERVA
jgi:hypothetical protein